MKIEAMKPIVYYEGPATFQAIKGRPSSVVAYVYGVDHPLLGTQLIRTSKVLSREEHGFETMNTLYREKQDD